MTIDPQLLHGPAPESTAMAFRSAAVYGTVTGQPPKAIGFTRSAAVDGVESYRSGQGIQQASFERELAIVSRELLRGGRERFSHGRFNILTERQWIEALPHSEGFSQGLRKLLSAKGWGLACPIGEQKRLSRHAWCHRPTL